MTQPTVLRHLARHLQATLAELVHDYLDELGWMGPASGVPFGALPVRLQQIRPSEALLQAVQPNLVAVSFGQQADDIDAELGGGLTSSELVFFIDVLAENAGVGLALADDLRDLLIGRAGTTLRTPSRYFQIRDQRTSPPTPVDGYLVEVDEVFREPSTRQVANADWQVVHGTLSLLAPGVS